TTGAALTRLVVKTPAAAQGRPATTSARSRAPLSLSPQAVAAAVNPGASENGAPAAGPRVAAGVIDPGSSIPGSCRAGRANCNPGGSCVVEAAEVRIHILSG